MTMDRRQRRIARRAPLPSRPGEVVAAGDRVELCLRRARIVGGVHRDGWLTRGDQGTVTAANEEMVLVRFDRRPRETAVCDPGEVRRVTPHPPPRVK